MSKNVILNKKIKVGEEKMQKKMILALCFLFAFFLALPKVSASSKVAIVTYNNASLRVSPGTNTSEITTLKSGSKYYLADNNVYTGTGCSPGWYKIVYNDSTTGYVCSTLLSVVAVSTDGLAPTTDCERNLSNLGFPSSYWAGLCSLKEKYPNWNFQPIVTNLDWSTAVEKESACKKSYISFASSTNYNYIDTSCNGDYAKSWYPASQTAVALYMDPRNWFDEKYIFQFNYLKYDSAISSYYPTGVKAIIGSSEFYKYNLNRGVDLASITTSAGSSTNVSPIFLASRMNKELGTSNSLQDLYSGTHGVYNFFNYGINDSCATSTGATNCGIAYAEQRGWTTPLLAIQGAAKLLASNYIDVGQYTTYLQKFNVAPSVSSNLYIHQYMTNISAPSDESKTTYSSYSTLQILNLGFTFYIPIYNNMNATITNSNSGASGDDSSNANSLPISTIVTSSGYKYTNGYMAGIPAGTDVSTIISSLQAVSGSSNIFVTNASGSRVESGTIGTGFKVSVSNSSTTEVLQAVVKGDTSGDGTINALDLLQVQKNILGSYSLSGATFLAGDTSGDGTINALDLLQIQKNILGLYTINQ